MGEEGNGDRNDKGKENGNRLGIWFIPITYGILLYLAVSNIGLVLNFTGNVLKLLAPFILGVLLACILNILTAFLERKLFYRLENSGRAFVKKLKRPLSILAAFVVVLAFMAAAVVFVVPQLVQSVSTLTARMPGYLKSIETFFDRLAGRFNLGSQYDRYWNKLASNWSKIVSGSGQFISAALPGILTFALGLTGGISNFVVGLIVSVYLLATKEKRLGNLKKLVYAFTSRKTAEGLVHIGRQAGRIFHDFFSGQILQALILGTLVSVGMLVFKFPYALLCGVVIGLTSLIPVFGAWIGAVPAAFLILLTEPSKTLWFILFIAVLQQLLGGLVYPRLVGSPLGLDGLWVLFAIVVGGSLFGIVGILLGIPVLALIHALVRRAVNCRLKEKDVTI